MGRPAAVPADPTDHALALFKALTSEQKARFIYVVKHISSEIFALAAPTPEPRKRNQKPKPAAKDAATA